MVDDTYFWLSFSAGLLLGWVTAVVIFFMISRIYVKEMRMMERSSDPMLRLTSQCVREGRKVQLTINPNVDDDEEDE